MAENKTTESLLLPEATRRKLDPLMLVARKIRAGTMKGERRSIKRGTSIEFADYRNYVAGDDLRQMDWNIYARLERPYIKLLEDEEDLAVHILLDISASMNWPTEGDQELNKLLFARRLYAALGYISLSSNDRMMLTAANDYGMEHFGPTRGRGQGVAMLRYIYNLQPRGITDINQMLKDYAVRASRPGLLILISDLFSPSGYLDGVNTLLAKGFEIAIIHVLSPDEVTPPLAGDLRLVDIETGRAQEVTIDASMRSIYQQRLETWRNGIHEECGRRGVHYLMVQTDEPWEKVILHDMRRLGLVR